MPSLPLAATGGLPAVHPRPIHALTGLRFVAALLVFLHHAAGSRYYEGFSGVTFFYVLSGFILTYNYEQTFTRLRVGELWTFYGSRLARVYPVHFLTFLAVAPLHWSQIGLQKSQLLSIAKNLTLTQSFGRSYFSFNAVAWSLSDEIFFYTMLPVVLWGLWKLHFYGAVPALLSISLIWFAAFGYVALHQDGPLAHWSCYINPLLRLGDFLIGVLLARLYARMPSRSLPFNPRHVLVYTALELLTVTCFVTAWECSRWVPVPFRLGPYYTPAMASIVFVFAFERGLLSRAAGTRLGRWLGEISFSFYMFHLMVIWYLTKYKESFRMGQFSDRTLMTVAFLASLVVGGLCYSWYESPMRRKLRLYLVAPRTGKMAIAEAQKAPSLPQAA